MISNFRDANGTYPNIPSNAKKRLVHRFYMYDTLSGIDDSNGYEKKSNPTYVRFASSVKLTVELGEDE